VRHGDFAMVAAAAQVAIDGDGRCVRAAFGLGGVGGTPLAFPELRHAWSAPGSTTRR